MGAAVQAMSFEDGQPERELLTTHHNSITAEYEMKADRIATADGVFDFTVADRFTDFAEANGMTVRGHALLWYQVTPEFFYNGSPDDIRARLENYVTTVVSRYAGRIGAWDVVNEATTDNGADSTAPYRDDRWFAEVGTDYIDWAFRAARAADPACKLYINDYGTESPGKRARFIEIIQGMLDRGVPLDGVGHQMHLNHETPLAEVEAALDAVDALGAGLEQQITELDVSVYNDPGSCYESGVSCMPGFSAELSSVPEAIHRRQVELYRGVFEAARSRASVNSVTLWGLSDAGTWLNDFPVTGRPNHPLLFDRNGDPKPASFALTDPDYTF